MRALRFLTLITVLLVLNPVPAQAAGRALTVGNLLASCRFSELMFAHKTSGLSAADIDDATFCNAYILGVVHGTTASAESGGQPFCMPRDWTLIKGVFIFIHWAEQNPRAGNMPSGTGVIASEKEAYPCAPQLHATTPVIPDSTNPTASEPPPMVIDSAPSSP